MTAATIESQLVTFAGPLIDLADIANQKKAGDRGDDRADCVAADDDPVRRQTDQIAPRTLLPTR